jgi:arginine exporter protein ArgO
LPLDRLAQGLLLGLTIAAAVGPISLLVIRRTLAVCRVRSATIRLESIGGSRVEADL